MAHSETTRQAVRQAYVFDRLSMEQAALRAGVSFGTASRWKKQAKASGEDWDKLRAANLLAGNGVEEVARQMLADYVVQHKTLMELIAEDAKATAGEKVSMLASLADSFNKTVAASRRVLPDTNELAVALEVINLLGEYVRDTFPHYAPAFLEILEPFSVVLAQHFSKKRG